ncbi:NAD(P)-dependent dehydrogenase (short-subunit alcohol dehydrogenase family) [Allocatelliglobosispora scoriae]|uniref:NAD(P)-dependent dehydrogenase (Short-subunit alcohol dehydrogenase family) n=1 Tax=Allocatelliglobosispora scoriae TaxID=643052 RepID=A0A841BI29_9ACTN|nr:NAD(P)-dependent dehydrogenase (short-subunit alcohol dehydrogenase family) [Allocatelliglobosispora scoriae]
MTGRRQENLDEAARTALDLHGATLLPIVAHTGDGDARGRAVDTVLAEPGRLDILVFNTGINPVRNASLMQTPLSAFQRMLETNVIAALGYAQLVWQAWMADHGGSIVLMSTVGASGSFRLGAYSATKAALAKLTTDLADQLAPGVRVNAVAPAFSDTAFADAVISIPRDQVAASYPMARMGMPGDVAAEVAYLVSPSAGWITGVTLPVDGGKSIATVTHDRPHPAVGQQVH